MAIKPSDIERSAIREAIAIAVRKRAPQSDLEAWYWEVQEDSGVGRDTIRALCRNEIGPATDILNFYRLLAAFGPEFGCDCLAALTGLHIGLEPSEAERELAELKAEIARLHERAGNGGPRAVPNESKIP